MQVIINNTKKLKDIILKIINNIILCSRNNNICNLFTTRFIKMAKSAYAGNNIRNNI